MVLEHLQERLLCSSESAAEARGMLRRLSVPLSRTDAETASLVLTELITNAIRHGCADSGAGVGVAIMRAPGYLRFEISQSGPVLDPQQIRQRRPGVERGYGILILDRLCRAWGVDTGVRMVWAEVPLDG